MMEQQPGLTEKQLLEIQLREAEAELEAFIEHHIDGSATYLQADHDAAVLKKKVEQLKNKITQSE